MEEKGEMWIFWPCECQGSCWLVIERVEMWGFGGRVKGGLCCVDDRKLFFGMGGLGGMRWLDGDSCGLRVWQVLMYISTAGWIER